MNAVMLREAVENYKKIQLYAVDDCAIEQSIIQELKMNILENNRKCLDSFIRTQLLAKVICYLEFGFAYEAYAAVFDQVLTLCATSKKDLNAYVNKEAQYVKLSRENLQKIVVWKTEQKQKYRKKGEIITEILSLGKQRCIGRYTYATEKSAFLLEIDSDLIILRNTRKGIFYYLI